MQLLPDAYPRLTRAQKDDGMTREILIIAGPEGEDDALVASAAAQRPRHVTVLIEAHDPAWGWSELRAAKARRDRLARLLTAVERATGAAVVGLVGDPARLDPGRFDAVVGGHGQPLAA
jgi:hypothetical protein